MSRAVPGVTVVVIYLILATIPTAAYAKPSTASQHMITEMTMEKRPVLKKDKLSS
ncbi:hypothetical protein [Methanosarcina acetivorans]|uniref:hypothetical protein n=1 Tax=Methanosarcina acetivorans TaxID=2214 RepID=UPI0012FE829C|nr:hypothetical protein [Methanosarcina acetivorans]